MDESFVGSVTEKNVNESTSVFPNPEQGYYAVVGHKASNLLQIAEKEYTLVNMRVLLDEFRNSNISSSFLAEFREGLGVVRNAGMKAILRFQYNNGSGDDATLERIQTHIGQLKPILEDNADVVMLVQAGFIGAWGEWHTSNTGLDNNNDRKTVVESLLNALPSERMVQIRKPTFKEELYPGGPMTSSTGFSETHRARIGHHNDCVLASENDQGTYSTPVSEWKDYLEKDSNYTPVGGEFCTRNANTDCDGAAGELARMQWSFSNIGYPNDVVDEWKSQGCFAWLGTRLGHRFVMDRVAWTEEPKSGEAMSLRIDIRNVGFAAMFNPRPVVVVLESASNRYELPLPSVDPRRWPGRGVAVLNAELSLDAVEPGTYRMSLWLPDASASLRNRPEYSIRFANEDVWNASSGTNLLVEELVVD